MIQKLIVLGALTALGQPKAIITNNCRKDIFIWSIPQGPNLASNLSVSQGKRYEEPWRYGTAVNPGIAIKISAEPDGIYNFKSEINFGYKIDPRDSSKVWIDLSRIRGSDFNDVTLHSCQDLPQGHPQYSVHQCGSIDDIELVFCGSERTVPVRDTTPEKVISRCIEPRSEHADSERARMCSGRVVGPKRVPVPADDQIDASLIERHETVPLKTVIRMKATNNAALQTNESHTTNEKRATRGPLCELLHSTWPDAQCDESIAEHNTRLFYQDNCGKKSKELYPGIDCEYVRRKLKSIYPDIVEKNTESTWQSLTNDTVVNRLAERGFHNQTLRDLNTTAAERGRDVRNVCVIQANEKLGKYWGEKTTERLVEQIFPDIHWVSDPEDCEPLAIAASRNYHHKLIDSSQDKKRFCVFNCEGKTCKKVKTELNKLSKDVGKHWGWTDDEKECTPPVDFGPAGPMGCIGSIETPFIKYWKSDARRHLQSIFLSRVTDLPNVCSQPYRDAATKYFHEHSVKEGRHCVSEHCKPYDADCSDVEDELEKASKDLGLEIDWTTDDDVCDRYSHTNHSRRGTPQH